MNKTLVIGMGKTGLSLARFLSPEFSGGLNAPDFSGGEIYAADTRAKPPFLARMQKLLGKTRCYAGEDFFAWPPAKIKQFNYIVPSPSMRLPQKWKAMKKPAVVSEIDLFNLAAACGKPPVVLGITGTNGKSTAAALAAALCRAAGMRAEIVGNFGEPLLEARMKWKIRRRKPAVAVAELSSFQLEFSSLRARAAAVLNVAPDHMDYHKNFAEYAKAKSRIYENADYGVVNLDDPVAAAMPVRARITFSARQKADWKLTANYISGGGMRFRRDEISPALPAENALAALALFSALRTNCAGEKNGAENKTPLLPQKLPQKKLAKVLAEFPGLPHRRQFAGEFCGVSYINDSKATNVASACFALNSIHGKHEKNGKIINGKIILIAGGEGKGQDFSPLAAACKRVKKAFLFGKDSELLRRALQKGGAECEIVSGMKSAAAGAVKTAKKGDTVLLSPACSSLDMYKNYAARGEDFLREVKKHARQ